MKASPARLLVALLSGCFVAHPQATAATLVEKGQARAVIIVPEKPSPVVANAARVLRDHIKQMTGAELPIRTEDRITGSPSQDQAWVLVGEGKLAKKLGLTSKGLGPGGIFQSATTPHRCRTRCLNLRRRSTMTDPSTVCPNSLTPCKKPDATVKKP